MTTRTLIFRSVRHYWRTHLGVVLGAALGALVLTGSLLTGDSVKATLKRQAHERIGEFQSAAIGGDRFFRDELATESARTKELGGDTTAVLMIRGSIERPDKKARVNLAQILGIDAYFHALQSPEWPTRQRGNINVGAGSIGMGEIPKNAAILNARLAAQLGVREGDSVIIRIEKPSNFSKDAPLSGEHNETIPIRVQVQSIYGAEEFGNFSLQANQVPPFNVFVDRKFLQERLGLPGGANLILSTASRAALLRADVAEHWQPADASLEIRTLEKGAGVDLRTGRVFIDAPIEAAAPSGVKALTYLVNEIRTGEKMIPYSMATALDTKAAGFLPNALGAGEAAISQWTANDLGIGPGAKLSLKYFVMGERRQLTEKTSEFTVAAVIPMEHPKLDSSWMPDFPGLSDKKNCRDWEPGFAMDTTKIRPVDEKYWDEYKGTPKVLIGLADGQKLWANRWGDITSIRYEPPATPEQIASALKAKLTPEQAGITFVDLAQQAQAATKAPVDFGELFAYFSFFLLAAAAILTGLLFVFALEQRNEEAGLLLAIGWRPRSVRLLLLGEGLVLAVLGSALGAAAAIAYTQLVLRALATIWRDAVGGARFEFSASPMTLAIGFCSGVVMALGAMWLASRRQLKHSARELLASAGSFEIAEAGAVKKRSWSLPIAIICLIGAIALLAMAGHGSAEIFFGAGALLLIAGIAFGLTWLRKTARSETVELSLPKLGERNAARRRGRSIATVAVLASGVFMVVAVDSFRQKPGDDSAADRKSGTGGFALIGESALPIYEDLNTEEGRKAATLDAESLAGVAVVPFRVREGDDASCLNLNRVVQPRLLGVKPADLISRGAFQFNGGQPASWEALNATGGDIPGIVDSTTLEYALQKKLGDTIPYIDERGAAFNVRLVATVAGSILQGSIVVPEARLVEKYPSQGGYRFFLIDAPRERRAAVSDALSRGLADRGFEVTPAARRLAEFQAVENTYLSIFQALGGLGLLLGSVGLAIVVARNVLERRREFGLLTAVGFRKGQLRRLVFAEHGWLIIAGLLIGSASAVVAVWPSLHDRASGFPLTGVLLLLSALTAGSLFWTWLATRLALRGEHLAALRTE